MKKTIIEPGCYNIRIEVINEKSGSITSDLNNCPELDSLECLILAHACSGVDVCDEKYVEGIHTAVDAVSVRL